MCVCVCVYECVFPENVWLYAFDFPRRRGATWDNLEGVYSQCVSGGCVPEEEEKTRKMEKNKRNETKKRFTHSFLLSSESASPKKGKVKRDGG